MIDGDWYQITTHFACFAVVIKDGIVIDSAPIGRKSIGRRAENVFAYYKNRFNAIIKKVD